MKSTSAERKNKKIKLLKFDARANIIICMDKIDLDANAWRLNA